MHPLYAPLNTVIDLRKNTPNTPPRKILWNLSKKKTQKTNKNHENKTNHTKKG